MGKTAEIVDLKWDGIVSGIKTGLYDISTSFVPVTPDMKEIVDLSNPLGKKGMALVTKQDFHFQDLQSLNHPKVHISSRNNAYSQGIVDKYLPKATSIKMSTYDTAFLELLQGKVTVVISNPVTAHAYGEKYKDMIYVRYESLSALPTAMVMRKTEDKELLSIVNNFLEDYIATGKMAILVDKYMSDLKKEYEKQGKHFQILFFFEYHEIMNGIQRKNWKDSDKLIVAIDLSVPNAYESRDPCPGILMAFLTNFLIL